ncbi:hypothetical protein DFS33DRAFT_1278144 [Desarmillaria ectypa]|nr:hypothetical protein DFS33DRAFT_1278144 [Desarmillaria ectypa]
MTKASPNLLSYVMDTRILGTTVHSILAPVLPLMINLTSLKIQFIKLAKIRDLHTHVFQLLGLKQFSLDGFYYDKEGPPFSPPPTQRGPALERMDLVVDGNLHLLPSFFHAGLRSVYIDTLQYLEVDKPAEKDLRVLSELTRVAGSLKHLRLLEVQWDVRHWPDPPTLVLTGLETLSMEMWYKDDLARIDLCLLRWLISSLSSMDETLSLQSLELKLKCWEDSELQEVDEMWILWMQLDGILSRANLSRLRQLRVKISGEETTEEGLLYAQSLTNHRFLLALQRGILMHLMNPFYADASLDSSADGSQNYHIDLLNHAVKSSGTAVSRGASDSDLFTPPLDRLPHPRVIEPKFGFRNGVRISKACRSEEERKILRFEGS